MSSYIARKIPTERLKGLEFLLGEGSGLQTLYPPGEPPLQFPATYSASWEECERFVKIDFYARNPKYGIETYRALITWSEKHGCYRLWAFSATEEEPLHMLGDFDLEGRLVMISDPWQMPWGIQKMRGTFTQVEGGGFHYLGELWEPDGYAKYCNINFAPLEPGLSA